MGLIAIGDIHGCAATLDLLLARLDLSPDDHLVFVGDYIDRGPDARSVIQRLLQLREQYACTFLRGNHEALMLDYVDHGDYDLWYANGGRITLDSYGNAGGHVFEQHVDFVRETRLYHETPDFFFVHAGLKPFMTVAENVRLCGEDVFLWERSHLKAPNLAWEKTVVCGHTPQPEPILRDRLIAIDTGCVFYAYPHFGRLTAIRLPERTVMSVGYVG